MRSRRRRDGVMDVYSYFVLALYLPRFCFTSTLPSRRGMDIKKRMNE